MWRARGKRFDSRGVRIRNSDAHAAIRRSGGNNACRFLFYFSQPFVYRYIRVQ